MFMKRICFLLSLFLVLLVACDKSTDYEFSYSTTARFHVPNTSKPGPIVGTCGVDIYSIPVDVYIKKNSDGSPSLGVKNDEGTIYPASDAMMAPVGYKHEVMGQFKFKGAIGTLYFCFFNGS